MQENITYKKSLEIKSFKKINLLLKYMPKYILEYIISIESQTSILTRLNYLYDLKIFFYFLSNKIFINKNIKEITFEDLSKITPQDIYLFLNFLNAYEYNNKINSCSECGKARKLCSVRAFFKFCFQNNYLDKNVTEIVKTPKIRDKEIIRLERNETKDEVKEMLKTVKNGIGLTQKQSYYHTKTQIRDYAIFAVFLGTGIRISELVGLNNNDINLTDNSMIVTRKGGNREIIYYNNDVKIAIQQYMNKKLFANICCANNDPLFVSLQMQRLSIRTIEKLIKKYASIVTPLKHITPHKLRSTFGTNLYQETRDIHIVASCLGHKDINTTKKYYANISDDIKKKAANYIDLKIND